MLFAYLFELLKKVIQTLTDNIGVATDLHKICVSIPSGNDMDMQMAGQACSAAPSKVHPDIKAVRFYRKPQCFL